MEEALGLKGAAEALDELQAITAEIVRQRFVEAGLAAPHERKAQSIAAALPFGAVATGDSPLEVLDLCITNYRNGAVNRLLKLHRDMTRGDRRRRGKGKEEQKPQRPHRARRKRT